MRNVILISLATLLLTGCPDSGIPNSVYRGVDIACKKHGGTENVIRKTSNTYEGTCKDNHKVNAQTTR